MDIPFKIENPDWNIFRKWAESRYGKGDPGSIRKIADATFFSCFPDDQRQNYLEKVLFKSLDDIPPCIKYIPPKSINFINKDPEFCGRQMQPVSIPIRPLISLDEEHYLCLHPVRYDLVKETVARGSIEMPIVYLDDDVASVGDGRHRMISILKFGFDQMDVLVPIDEKAEILRQINNASLRAQDSERLN